MLIACSDAVSQSQAETSGETTAEKTETDHISTLANADYEGYAFNILVYNNMYEEHRADGITGDVINDAVYNRNSYVSQRYNISINVTDMDDDTYRAALVSNVAAGEDAYDIYQIFLSAAASTFVTNGYFVDWLEIPYVSDNMQQPWWNRSSIDDLAVNGHNYLLNGDLGHLTLGDATCVIFNKQLFSSSNIESPYTDVSSGGWTLDRFAEICASMNSDLNGDGVIEHNSDRFAFTSTRWLAPIGMEVACDLNTLTYDDTGYPQLNFYTDKTVSAYEKIYNILVGNNVTLGPYNSDLMSSDEVKMFYENRAYMMAAPIANVSLLRSMDTDFGIVPYPKYDEEQTGYISSIDAGVSTATVAVTASDLERTGLIAEALCEKGYEIVIPAYYDITLKTKSTRDTDSEAMIDIIRAGSGFDPLYVYNFGGLGFAFIDWITSNTTDIASAYASIEDKANAAIASIWNIG